jgi:hypothetical protein
VPANTSYVAGELHDARGHCSFADGAVTWSARLRRRRLDAHVTFQALVGNGTTRSPTSRRYSATNSPEPVNSNDVDNAMVHVPADRFGLVRPGTISSDTGGIELRRQRRDL